jgi:hypothetical protein
LVMLSEDVLKHAAASWRGTVRAFGPTGSELGVGYWELHHVVAAAVSTVVAGGSSLPEPGLTSQKTLPWFGDAVSAAASNVHQGTWGSYVMACDCCR